jgi:NAD(P)-dependent dehydrogenase (short-subunit alcohol dehydrogenase family)
MNRVVLITGGSGAVGSAMVERFLQNGDHVAFTYHKNEAKALAIEKDSKAVGYKADLTKKSDVVAMVSKIHEDMGSIDVLINNAGLTQIMPFALLEEEDWDYIISANLKTMYLVTRECVRDMIIKKKGAIVNIGSIAGHRLLEVPVHYATAKAGVSGFTISLAKELSRYNIRVNSLVPGLLSEGVGRMVPENKLNEYLSYCTAGRPGSPREAAATAFFLASDDASYINAQIVIMDGGL